eukprot:CAMPEP_0171551746 /NCGR_PEP_ID=MMETSP0960-20121227/7904_1 /TAXON_ID=87120 /ORGANISM="Aurantiochytrium limacinum, Strain ATCCMYA-1381" /LENGTH=146 /DNA_ID=CAMNT_0012101053 /DNA_START=67 /DNA_END=507 /DNA_ORIENTATION=-
MMDFARKLGENLKRGAERVRREHTHPRTTLAVEKYSGEDSLRMVAIIFTQHVLRVRAQIRQEGEAPQGLPKGGCCKLNAAAGQLRRGAEPSKRSTPGFRPLARSSASRGVSFSKPTRVGLSSPTSLEEDHRDNRDLCCGGEPHPES